MILKIFSLVCQIDAQAAEFSHSEVQIPFDLKSYKQEALQEHPKYIKTLLKTPQKFSVNQFQNFFKSIDRNGMRLRKNGSRVFSGYIAFAEYIAYFESPSLKSSLDAATVATLILLDKIDFVDREIGKYKAPRLTYKTTSVDNEVPRFKPVKEAEFIIEFCPLEIIKKMTTEELSAQYPAFYARFGTTLKLSILSSVDSRELLSKRLKTSPSLELIQQEDEGGLRKQNFSDYKITEPRLTRERSKTLDPSGAITFPEIASSSYDGVEAKGGMPKDSHRFSLKRLDSVSLLRKKKKDKAKQGTNE